MSSKEPIQSHDVTVRVRYCETDAMGYLHHGNHIDLFEMGRTELLRAQGGSYREMEESGLFPRRHPRGMRLQAPREIR